MDEIRCDNLLHEIAIGNRIALRDLYAEMSRTIFSYALSMVKSRQMAEDITQDVFVKISMVSGKYKKSGNANGWILTLTRNLAIDKLKKSKHEVTVDFIPEDTSNEISVDISDKIMLKEALISLSKIDRQIIMLYLVAGVSQKDIAKLLKLPVTTVNWRYREGLKKLSMILK